MINEDEKARRLKSVTSGAPLCTSSSININRLMKDNSRQALRAKEVGKQKPYYLTYKEKMEKLKNK